MREFIVGIPDNPLDNCVIFEDGELVIENGYAIEPEKSDLKLKHGKIKEWIRVREIK